MAIAMQPGSHSSSKGQRVCFLYPGQQLGKRTQATRLQQHARECRRHPQRCQQATLQRNRCRVSVAGRSSCFVLYL